jgi:acyl carrier protein
MFLKMEVRVDQKSLLIFLEEVISNASDQESIVLTMDDNIDTVSSWDSLVTVSIAAALTEEFNIKLSMNDLEKLSSVSSIFEILLKK